MPANTGQTNRNAPAFVSSMIALLLMGAIAGFFYAYSSSVMRGLDAAEPAHAIAAMQGINAEVRNTVFGISFFGAPVACLIAAAMLLRHGVRRAAALMALAGAVYVGGALLPTFLINIPMNEALAGTAIPTDPKAASALWQDYSARWTLWNHLRTGFSLASVLLVGAAMYMAGHAEG